MLYIYIENDIESHRSTQSINILSKTHQKHENTYIFFEKTPKTKNPYFRKIKKKTCPKESADYADLYGIMYILC